MASPEIPTSLLHQLFLLLIRYYTLTTHSFRMMQLWTLSEHSVELCFGGP